MTKPFKADQLTELDIERLKEVLNLAKDHPIKVLSFNGLMIEFGEKITPETDVKLTTTSKPLKQRMPTDDELLLYATEHYDQVVMDRSES